VEFPLLVLLLGVYVIALPEVDTAMQNTVIGHDTDESDSLEAIGVDDHDEPLNCRALPALSTAMQNVADGQDTDDM
jgi:hypothetical protein